MFEEFRLADNDRVHHSAGVVPTANQSHKALLSMPMQFNEATDENQKWETTPKRNQSIGKFSPTQAGFSADLIR
jgi:hypothetical protein